MIPELREDEINWALEVRGPDRGKGSGAGYRMLAQEAVRALREVTLERDRIREQYWLLRDSMIEDRKGA